MCRAGVKVLALTLLLAACGSSALPMVDGGVPRDGGSTSDGGLTSDGGTSRDGGSAQDGGLLDAGMTLEGGTAPDGGPRDAGIPIDAGATPDSGIRDAGIAVDGGAAHDGGLHDAGVGVDGGAAQDGGAADGGLDLDGGTCSDASECQPYWCGCGRCTVDQITCVKTPPPCPLGCPSFECPELEQTVCDCRGGRCGRVDGGSSGCSSAADCGPGSNCCYPCGIPGCAHVCLFTDGGRCPQFP